MSSRIQSVSFVAMLLSVLFIAGLIAAQSPIPPPDVVHEYGQLPLAFELNIGQADPEIQFFSRAQGQLAYFTPRSMTLLLQSDVKGTSGDIIRFSLSEWGTSSHLVGEGKLPGKVNYLEAPRSQRPVTGVPLYSHLRYKGAYPGIDVVFYGNHRTLEYDFEVSPGSDPTQIKLHVEGAQALKVRADGGLLIQGKYGTLRWDKPRAYQEYLDRGKVEIASSYVVEGNDISFRVADYDKQALLVIDPQLVYSTYVGGNDFAFCCNSLTSIAVDKQGFAYITGTSVQLDHPVTPGAYDARQRSGLFVTKLSRDGSSLVYSTHLTGDSFGGNTKSAIAVDDAGNAYVSGEVGGTFETTPGAFRRTLAGPNDNAFVLKLNAAGTDVIYSTYIGQLGDAGSVTGIALNTTVASNNPKAYITGFVQGNENFPTTESAFQRTAPGGYAVGLDAFVTVVNGDGSNLVYSTYLGGSSNLDENTNLTGEDRANDIVVRPSGNAIVTGFTRSDNFPATNTNFGQILATGNSDIFVTELNSTGSALVWSDLVGGPYDDFGEALALDPAGNVYVGGDSWGGNFPTTSTAFQKFSNNTKDGVVFVLSPNGLSMIGSTFLGGELAPPFPWGLEHVAGLATDGKSVHVTGNTISIDFPTTPDAFQRTFPGSSPFPGGNAYGGFYSVLNPQMSQLIYSTYFYSSGVFRPFNAPATEPEAVALDPQGNAYITGLASSGLPTTLNAYQRTTSTPYNLPFVAKFGSLGGTGDCTQGQVNVTAPQNGFSGPSPVHFQASARSGCRITGMNIYQDNALIFKTASATIDTNLLIPVGTHDMVVQAFNNAGKFFKTPVGIMVTSGGGGGSCSASPGTVRLCSPADGSTLPTPVRFSGVGALSGQTLLRLYIDNAPVLETSAASFGTSISLGSGAHYVVLVGYDNHGGAQIYPIHFTSTGTGTIGCGTPSMNKTILICSPGQGQTVDGPFQLNARARWDGNTITHMRVYSDNQPVYDRDHPPDGLITPTLNLTAGPHRILIVAWNNQGASIASAALNITVK